MTAPAPELIIPQVAAEAASTALMIDSIVACCIPPAFASAPTPLLPCSCQLSPPHHDNADENDCYSILQYRAAPGTVPSSTVRYSNSTA